MYKVEKILYLATLIALGTVAQSVEHATENRGVAGSIPAGPTQSPATL